MPAKLSGAGSWRGPWLSCQPKKPRNMRSMRRLGGTLRSDRMSMAGCVLVAARVTAACRQMCVCVSGFGAKEKDCAQLRETLPRFGTT